MYPPHLEAVATVPWENPNSHVSTILFIRDSNYLRYLRIKWTATVTLQLNHNCLLTVTWTIRYYRASRPKWAPTNV